MAYIEFHMLTVPDALIAATAKINRSLMEAKILAVSTFMPKRSRNKSNTFLDNATGD